MKIYIFFGIITLLASCTPENGDLITTQNTSLQSYLSSNKLTYEQKGSVYHVVSTRGYGYKPNIGDTVVFNYTEYIFNPRISFNALSTPIMSNVLDTIERNGIDTTYFKPVPTTVILGRTNLIGGISEGLMMLQQGEVGDIFFTSDLGYGSKEVGPIPANSIIRFRIHILFVSGSAIQNERATIFNYATSNSIPNTALQPQGFYFIPITQHTESLASAGDTVYAHYSCYTLDGTNISALSVSDSRVASFVVGKRLPVQGLDLAFQLMASRDTAEVIMPSCLAYGNGGLTNVVGPYEPLRYTVVLDSIKGH